MDLKLRKFTKFVDKTFIEGGKKAKEPVLLVSVAAVIENPWAGKGFVEDLKFLKRQNLKQKIEMCHLVKVLV